MRGDPVGARDIDLANAFANNSPGRAWMRMAEQATRRWREQGESDDPAAQPDRAELP
jgi:hypothetical protein